MARILVCTANDQIGREDEHYFQQIHPIFIERHHQLELVTPDQVWDRLLATPVDVLLPFVRSKESACWDVLRRIRDAWPADRAQPGILLIIERCFEDYDDDSKVYLTQFLDQPDYPEIQMAFDRETRPYHWEPEYLGLWQDILITFDWPSRNIVARVERLLFYRHLELASVKTQIAALLPEQAVWTLAENPIRILYHPIIDLHIHAPKQERIIPMVWSWENKIWLVENEHGFRQFIVDEQLQLADKCGREDMLTLFSYFQQRNIVRRVFHAEATPAWRRELIQEYAEVVTPPAYYTDGKKHHVRFWAIDTTDPGGNLEEWLFTQQGTDFQMQSWLKVEDFRKKFVSEGNQMYFLCYGMPPDMD